MAYSGYNFADSLGVIGTPLSPGTSRLPVGQRVAALLPDTGRYAEAAVAGADAPHH